MHENLYDTSIPRHVHQKLFASDLKSSLTTDEVRIFTRWTSLVLIHDKRDEDISPPVSADYSKRGILILPMVRTLKKMTQGLELAETLCHLFARAFIQEHCCDSE